MMDSDDQNETRIIDKAEIPINSAKGSDERKNADEMRTTDISALTTITSNML